MGRRRGPATDAPLAAGAAATLERADDLLASADPDALRQLFRHDLPARLERAIAAPWDVLDRGSYLAVVPGSPFLEGRLSGADDDRLRSVVLGRFTPGEVR